VGSIGTGTFEGKIGSNRFTSLATLQTNTTEAHAVAVDMTIFASGPAFPSNPYPAKATVDLQLAAGCAAVDKGVVLAGVNDGYTGVAPELGAYELGIAPPVYGPRQGATTGTGGAAGTGGTLGTGGATGSGGVLGSGGVVRTGGAAGSGGVSGSGGVVGTGGAAGSGALRARAAPVAPEATRPTAERRPEKPRGAVVPPPDRPAEVRSHCSRYSGWRA
jgi:hypothetical protein